MRDASIVVAAIAVAFLLCPTSGGALENSAAKIGLKPKYPADRNCSPLTSLYLSWIDVDGSMRDEPHVGVDGGRLGDPVLAPASGVVVAVWQGDWHWGLEGALLIRHDRNDLGVQGGPEHYYSEFDHLRYDEIRSIAVGQKLKRGDRLATVFRPGGKPQYLPEVHWEVWAVDDDAAIKWETNEFGEPDWVNPAAHLVDPLSLFSLNTPPYPDGTMDIEPFDGRRDYGKYRGFTYILPCPHKSE